MSSLTAQFSLTTTPVKILTSDSVAEKVYIHSETAIAYLGFDSSVSSSTGYKLDVNDKIVLDNHEGELWAVSSSAGTLSFMSINK
jgi:hypothetical protein